MKTYLLPLAISLMLLISCEKNASVNAPQSGSGQGGSLARFTITGSYLYTVDGRYLSTFDISNPTAPALRNKTHIGFDIEAIFPFRDKLFIASNSAMYIYSIADPINPTQEALVEHLTGCDPIVANDSVAYLTIHGGNRCGSMLNELQVYDVKNIRNPKWIRSINMSNPRGLGMTDSTLFVCDNGTGIRVYDIMAPYKPVAQEILTGENFLDVIITPLSGSMTLMTCMLTDGVAYYDISNRKKITKLGTVKN